MLRSTFLLATSENALHGIFRGALLFFLCFAALVLSGAPVLAQTDDEQQETAGRQAPNQQAPGQDDGADAQQDDEQDDEQDAEQDGEQDAGQDAGQDKTATADPDARAASKAARPSVPAHTEEIIVTGSRIRRDTFSTALPLTVITQEGAALAGMSNTAEVLQSSALASGVQVDNSFSGFVVSGGPGVNSFGLRSLDPGRTLILVNGRRFTPGGHARPGQQYRPQFHPGRSHRPY